MHKQLDQKHVNFLGHNNPPKNIKSIDLTNSAIEKLKVNSIDFGKSRYLIFYLRILNGSWKQSISSKVSKKIWLKGGKIVSIINEIEIIE